MKYKVTIRKNDTGEVRIKDMKSIEWGDHSVYWWTEGNFGCDCNRDREFKRAGGEEIDPDDDSDRCGDTAYTALFAELENGKQVQIDAF